MVLQDGHSSSGSFGGLHLPQYGLHTCMDVAMGSSQYMIVFGFHIHATG